MNKGYNRLSQRSTVCSPVDIGVLPKTPCRQAIPVFSFIPTSCKASPCDVPAVRVLAIPKKSTTTIALTVLLIWKLLLSHNSNRKSRSMLTLQRAMSLLLRSPFVLASYARRPHSPAILRDMGPPPVPSQVCLHHHSHRLRPSISLLGEFIYWSPPAAPSCLLCRSQNKLLGSASQNRSG